MPHVSDRLLLVLHGLKIKGLAEPDAIASVVASDSSIVADVLVGLVAAGHVARRDGRISGFVLTSPGRAFHSVLLASDVEASGQRDLVHARYREFLMLNGELVAVCTAWQVKDLATNLRNDHADDVYDAAVVARLATLHARVEPICDSLETAMMRYGGYRSRFGRALSRVRNGEREWFATPILDSYHTVWMELHDDLLATLAIERAMEGGEATEV